MHPLMHALDAGRPARPFDAELAEMLDTLALARPAPAGVTRRKRGSAAGASAGAGRRDRRAAAGRTRRPRRARKARRPARSRPTSFIRIGTDNLVTIVCKHHEMGQGNTTGLASLAGRRGSTPTGRSCAPRYAPSNPKLYAKPAVRDAAGHGRPRPRSRTPTCSTAAPAPRARAMLVAGRRARRWDVPASEVKTERNVLSHASGKRATYGEMAAAAAKETPPAKPELKTPAQFTLIGKERATPARGLGLEVRRNGRLHHRRQACRAC